MAALKKDIRINLLPKDKLAETPLGRILRWMLSTFRIIVIVAEMVVMLAFFSRFWLDAKNSDLDDEIEEKTVLIASYDSFEKEYRAIQNRLKVFQALSAEKFFSTNLNTISSYLPPEITVSSFSATGNEITLTGLSPFEQSIAQFIVNLESDKTIESVTLTQVNTGEENQGLILFALKINIKKGVI